MNGITFDEIALYFGKDWEYQGSEIHPATGEFHIEYLTLKRSYVLAHQPMELWGPPITRSQTVTLEAVMPNAANIDLRAFYKAWGEYFRVNGSNGYFEYSPTA